MCWRNECGLCVRRIEYHKKKKVKKEQEKVANNMEHWNTTTTEVKGTGKKGNQLF